MRRTKWVLGVVAALVVPGAASAKRPEPVPEAQLTPCVELLRQRLTGFAASNEAQVASELSDALPEGETRHKGVVLASRQGTAGTEIVVVSHMPLAVGGKGTFGAWPMTITEASRGYAVASVKAPLAEVEARRAKDRGVWLDPGPDGDSGDAASYPQVADHGTRLSREVTVKAVEAMNKQGGLPWLAWTNTTSRPILKRVKVVPFNDGGVEWVPLEDPDSALHPLFVFALDLEGNGTPYLAIAYNESPVSDATEVWRETKGKWRKVGGASGNLAVVARTASSTQVELAFDSYLDASVLSLDVSASRAAASLDVSASRAAASLDASGSAKLSTRCIAKDELYLGGGDGDLKWSHLLASEGPRRVKPGEAPVPSLTYLSLEAPDGVVARGTRVWRLAVFGDKALVALVARNPKTLSKEQRPFASRVLELAWVPSAELE